jgi:hypothetical protein
MGTAVFKHACKLGLKGIVSKRKDSRYSSGRTALDQNERQRCSEKQKKIGACVVGAGEVSGRALIAPITPALAARALLPPRAADPGVFAFPVDARNGSAEAAQNNRV